MKIMHVNNTLNIGGIEKFLLNVSKNIDLKKYEFVFLTYNDFKYDLEDEFTKLGCRIYRIDNPNKVSKIKHIKQIYNVIKKEKIDVIHTHTYFNSIYVMIASILAKVNTRIVHSHTAFALNDNSISKRIARKMLNVFATEKIACSKDAGYALFGKNSNFQIISNGIDFNKFYFNEQIRNKIRKQYNINDNELLIGHVGRFDTPKNHKFLIKIFSEIIKQNKNYKLMLVGSGPLENNIKEISKEFADKIIFLGNREDVNDIINAFDIIVFPSVFEGIPLTLIEAQVNGIPIIASTNVSTDVKLTDRVEFYSLNNNPKLWANKVIKYNKQRVDTKQKMLKSDYSINKVVKKLEKIYGDNHEK